MNNHLVRVGLGAVAFGAVGDSARAAALSIESTPAQFALGASLLKTSLILGLVIVALAVALRLFARWNRVVARARPSARIEVLESKRLEPKRTLHVVRVEGQRWLVASCEGGMSLTALPIESSDQRAADEPEQASRAPRFAELLTRRVVGGRA